MIHQSNKGISGARNAGLDAACGKYITFVDGDDFISPELCMALAMVRSYYCHPDNPHKSLRKEFRAFCEIPLVAEAIRRASLRSMRLCKMKFCIYALKWRLYGIAARFALFWNL